MSIQGDKDGWVRDGHRVTVVADHDTVNLRLVCPDTGCQPGMACGKCGRALDSDVERCCDCPDRSEPCWLTGWAENVLWEELHTSGERDLSGLTLPAEIEYRPGSTGDGEPEWRFV
jgi:hypothetical protein